MITMRSEQSTHFLQECNEDANEEMGNLLVISNREDENDISSRKQAVLDMWKKRKKKSDKSLTDTELARLAKAALPSIYIFYQLSSHMLSAYVDAVPAACSAISGTILIWWHQDL